MSFLHPDEARECQRCSHRWQAEKWTKSQSQQPILGLGITARAQDLARQTVHERRDRLHRAWRYCPECNSKKVKTLKGKDANQFGAPVVEPASRPNVQSDVEGSPAHAPQQHGFSILLVDVGRKKIQVIKALKNFAGLDLKQAKELAERAPVVVLETLDLDRAKDAQEQLMSVGAVTELLTPLEEPAASTSHDSPDRASRHSSTLGAPTTPTVADEIEKLAALRDRGILSQDEFEAAKSRLLA